MKITKDIVGYGSWYLTQALGRFKSLEAGYQITQRESLGASVRFVTKQDHAGLRCSISIGRLFAEFNICDRRHWNHEADRFYFEDEEPVFEGYPLA